MLAVHVAALVGGIMLALGSGFIGYEVYRLVHWKVVPKAEVMKAVDKPVSEVKAGISKAEKEVKHEVDHLEGK